MSTSTPSVGRVVHYVSHGSPVREDGTQAFVPQCRAATVTEVNAEEPMQIGLAVHNPTGTFFHPLSQGGCFDSPAENRRGGTCHWPERV